MRGPFPRRDGFPAAGNVSGRLAASRDRSPGPIILSSRRTAFRRIGWRLPAAGDGFPVPGPVPAAGDRLRRLPGTVPAGMAGGFPVRRLAASRNRYREGMLCQLYGL